MMKVPQAILLCSIICMLAVGSAQALLVANGDFSSTIQVAPARTIDGTNFAQHAILSSDYVSDGWISTQGYGTSWQQVGSGGPDGSEYASLSWSTKWGRGMVNVTKDDGATTGVQTLNFDLLHNKGVMAVIVNGINDPEDDGWDGGIQGTAGGAPWGAEQSAHYKLAPYNWDSVNPADGTELLRKTTRQGDMSLSADWQSYSFDVDLGAGYDWILISFGVARDGIDGDGDQYLDTGLDNVELVPEPATLLLLGLGGLLLRKRR